MLAQSRQFPLRTLCAVGAVFAAPVWLGLFFSCTSIILDRAQRLDLPLHPDPIPFESQRWQADTQGFCEVRLAMLDDLLASGVLIGKSRIEVETLLGSGGSAKDYSTLEIQPSPSPFDLIFSVGCRDLSSNRIDPFGIDCSYVLVRFGPDGRASEASALRQ